MACEEEDDPGDMGGMVEEEEDPEGTHGGGRPNNEGNLEEEDPGGMGEEDE